MINGNPNNNVKFFTFYLESKPNQIYKIPQTIVDGSDRFVVNSSWSKENLPGSTEPIVAFGYVDAPTSAVQLKFHQDMWRDLGWKPQLYLDVIAAFVSMAYPAESGSIIKPPYVIVEYENIVYRGYFSGITITQYGPLRTYNSITYKPICEINTTLNIIKKTSPKASNIGQGFRIYFGKENG